ncbi:EAL domain-containing protein [Roseibium sp.]|uniref:EAL domain-containing protein n=1 Tax=Roseibium sp. TaxID=1936156 RepID=UPI003A977084
MAIIAASVAAVLFYQFQRPIGEAASLALALMCTMMVFHLLVSRARDRGAVSDAVDRLEDRMAELDEDVGNLEGRLTGVEHTIPRRTREEIDPLFAEVEVLGTLVKQMAEAMSDLEARVEDQQALPPMPAHHELPPMSQPHLLAQSQASAPASYTPQQGGYGGAPSPAPAPDRSRYAPETREDTFRDQRNAPQRQVPEAKGARSNEREQADVQEHMFEDTRAEERQREVRQQPASQASDPLMRELIMSALNANRVELHLQPIVSLPQRQVKYYEAFTRLRDSRGEMVEAAVFLPEAVRSGLIARIDNLLLFRSVQVIRRLTSRNRNAALFCNISSLSLVDETFFPGFLEFVNANKQLADVLIFEFSQDDVAEMGVMEMESLGALSEIGFHFSVDRITDMRMDFKSLAQKGFKFAKLHADYLIGRRSTDHGHIHPSDFGDLLHRYGIELITDHVETESQVLELLDYDVRMAQGNLFSPPRPVRAEVLQGTPAPAARKRAAE